MPLQEKFTVYCTFENKILSVGKYIYMVKYLLYCIYERAERFMADIIHVIRIENYNLHVLLLVPSLECFRNDDTNSGHCSRISAEIVGSISVPDHLRRQSLRDWPGVCSVR